MDDVFHPQKGGLSSLKQTARASPLEVWRFRLVQTHRFLVAFAVSFREGTSNNFFNEKLDHMGVSLNGGTPKTPQNDNFLVGKPMVVGYHHFRKPPNIPMFKKKRTDTSGKELPALIMYENESFGFWLL